MQGSKDSCYKLLGCWVFSVDCHLNRCLLCTTFSRSPCLLILCSQKRDGRKGGIDVRKVTKKHVPVDHYFSHRKEIVVVPNRIKLGFFFNAKSVFLAREREKTKQKMEAHSIQKNSLSSRRLNSFVPFCEG